MKSGQLRGCIGSGRPVYPLYQAVVSSGLHAAGGAHRFTPVQPDELEGLDIEVSVMTPPERVESYLDFVLGEDGIILEKADRSALFLPQVATEQGWDLETTLNHLSRKAGLPEEAWRKGTSFEVFEAIVFHEQ